MTWGAGKMIEGNMNIERLILGYIFVEKNAMPWQA